MDFITLSLLLLALIIVLIATSRLPPLKWAKREWYLMRRDIWAPDVDAGPCTVEGDPRVERMEAKQRALGKRLRREGKTLHAGKKYVPVLTKPAQPEPVPPKANKVVSILRTKR